MGEAKRREELGLPPREKKKEKQTSKNQLNKILIKLTVKNLNLEQYTTTRYIE